MLRQANTDKAFESIEEAMIIIPVSLVNTHIISKNNG